jgi:Predicted transcriptional regulators
MNTLGSRIKALRTDSGLSQPKLAKIIGVNNSAISFWENDVNEPKANYIVKLAKAFNITTDELLDAENIDTAKITKIKSEIQILFDSMNYAHRNMLKNIAEEFLRAENQDPVGILKSDKGAVEKR